MTLKYPKTLALTRKRIKGYLILDFDESRIHALLNVELPYDPTILLPGIYSDKTIIRKDTCPHMFKAALFTTAKT